MNMHLKAVKVPVTQLLSLIITHYDTREMMHIPLVMICRADVESYLSKY